MRITCKKYSEISVPYEYRIIARDLSNNRGIISLQQDKGRGVVRINSENAWINVLILNTEQLIKVLNGPASYIEKKKLNVIREKSSKKYPKTFIQRFTQQDHHQPNCMAHPRFTSYQSIIQLMIYLFNQLFLTSK